MSMRRFSAIKNKLYRMSYTLLGLCHYAFCIKLQNNECKVFFQLMPILTKGR